MFTSLPVKTTTPLTGVNDVCFPLSHRHYRYDSKVLPQIGTIRSSLFSLSSPSLPITFHCVNFLSINHQEADIFHPN